MPESGVVRVRSFFFPDVIDSSRLPDWYEIAGSKRWKSPNNELVVEYAFDSGSALAWLEPENQIISTTDSSAVLLLRVRSDDSLGTGSYWICIQQVE